MQLSEFFDLFLNIGASFNIASLEIVNRYLHVLLLPFHDFQDLIRLFRVNLIQLSINVLELFHDLDVLTSGFFVETSVSLCLSLDADVEGENFLVKLLLQASDTILNGFLDYGKITLPCSVRIIVTFQFLLNDEHERLEIIWGDFVIDKSRIVSHD